MTGTTTIEEVQVALSVLSNTVQKALQDFYTATGKVPLLDISYIDGPHTIITVTSKIELHEQRYF